MRLKPLENKEFQLPEIARLNNALSLLQKVFCVSQFSQRVKTIITVILTIAPVSPSK